MTETRVWLVERESFGDEEMVTLVYATEDGERRHRKQLHTNLLLKKSITAATTVDPDRLDPVADEDLVERYADEAERMRERHDPDEEV